MIYYFLKKSGKWKFCYIYSFENENNKKWNLDNIIIIFNDKKYLVEFKKKIYDNLKKFNIGVNVKNEGNWNFEILRKNSSPKIGEIILINNKTSIIYSIEKLLIKDTNKKKNFKCYY